MITIWLLQMASIQVDDFVTSDILYVSKKYNNLHVIHIIYLKQLYTCIAQNEGWETILRRLKLMVVNYMCKPDHLYV